MGAKRVIPISRYIKTAGASSHNPHRNLAPFNPILKDGVLWSSFYKKFILLRLGANLFRMRSLRDEDILLARLRLLVMMAKAFLHGYPLGKVSLQSIHRNGIYLAGFLTNWYDVLANLNTGNIMEKNLDLDHIFFQRAKLLTIMVKSFADGNPMGPHRKKALQNNIQYISGMLPRLQSLPRTHLAVVK